MRAGDGAGAVLAIGAAPRIPQPIGRIQPRRVLTLDAVAALSGYVLAPPGRSPLAFSVLVNGIPGKVGAARPGMDRVVEAAAQELWRGVAP